MKDCIIIKDDFCDHLDVVRASVLASGFGTLTPASAEMGSSSYEGMGFLGRHDLMLRSLITAVGGQPICPGAMFFRATKPGMEKSHIHSDREHGDYTCIVYMSDHPGEQSGTAFFRQRRTGWREQPSFEQLKKANMLDKLNESMLASDEKDWEQTDFVRGLVNRAVIFHAPLFHARIPKDGLGNGNDQTARMCWVCHFSMYRNG